MKLFDAADSSSHWDSSIVWRACTATEPVTPS